VASFHRNLRGSAALNGGGQIFADAVRATAIMVNSLSENLVVEAEPSPDDTRRLDESIYDFNVQVTGISDGKLFGLFLRDSDGVVIGGTHGWTWAGTCYVSTLFVPAHMRNQGHGTTLMHAVEAEARSRGCQRILLRTLDFQAPEFYRRLGFKIISSVPDCPHGHRSITMAKYLTSQGDGH
jgi:GNAT superfamily N-acetyltransferase